MNTIRTKKLVKDIGLFGIASFVPKILAFLLTPLYTSCLSTHVFGVFDLLSTVISLLLPVCTLDISDAILIYTVDLLKENNKVFSPLLFGKRIVFFSLLPLLGIICFCVLFTQNNTLWFYGCYILLSYFIMSSYNNFLAYARGINAVGTIVIASIINSFVTVSANVIFILFFSMGINGLMLASILGVLCADIWMLYKIDYFRMHKKSVPLTVETKRSMLRYSFPLIFTGLSWWINNSSDRFFISWFRGVSDNGIYAVANKIPTILTACHGVIYQAMQLSVINEITADDGELYVKKLYDMYTFVMIVTCSFLIMLDKVIALFLFRGDFYEAWKYAPGLLISTALFSISGYLTTICSAKRETKIISISTVIGAILNTALNSLLIPALGIMGAVIATVVGYYTIWFIMQYNTTTLLLKIDFRKVVFGSIILILQWIVLFYCNGLRLYLLETLLFVCVLAPYKEIAIQLVGAFCLLISNHFKHTQ